MSVIRSLMVVALLFGLSSSAWAMPVTSYRTVLFDRLGTAVPGTITATFDLYTRPFGDKFGCCAPTEPPILLDQFSLGLGSDFWVTIPQIADPHASWEMPIPTGSSGLSGFPLPGFNRVLQSPGGTNVETLSEWCSLPNHFFPDEIFVVARRGTCTFADKVDNIQTRNGVGAIIVNDIPLSGAMGMAFVGFTPSVPVISVSYEVGQAIIMALNLKGDDAFDDLVYVDFSTRWDPDPPGPAAVPEPASLALLAAGLAGLAARRSRRQP